MSRRSITMLKPGEAGRAESRNRAPSKIRKFFRLPPSDQFLFFRFALFVPILEVGLRALGYRRITRLLARVPLNQTLKANQEFEVERHRKLLFQFYLQFPFAGRCLARALALWCFLNRLGISTNIRFGVRKESGRLAAHAWVEFNNQPLTIDRNVSKTYVVPDWPVGPGIKLVR